MQEKENDETDRDDPRFDGLERGPSAFGDRGENREQAQEDQRGVAATMPASRLCGSRISSSATACDRAMIDCEIAEC